MIRSKSKCTPGTLGGTVIPGGRTRLSVLIDTTSDDRGLTLFDDGDAFPASFVSVNAYGYWSPTYTAANGQRFSLQGHGWYT